MFVHCRRARAVICTININIVETLDLSGVVILQVAMQLQNVLILG